MIKPVKFNTPYFITHKGSTSDYSPYTGITRINPLHSSGLPDKYYLINKLFDMNRHKSDKHCLLINQKDKHNEASIKNNRPFGELKGIAH